MVKLLAPPNLTGILLSPAKCAYGLDIILSQFLMTHGEGAWLPKLRHMERFNVIHLTKIAINI